MLLVAVDVIGRYVFNRPITAVIELGQVMQAMMFFLAWAFTTYTKGHVTVTLFASRFSPRVQTITQFVITLVVIVLLSLIAWQGVNTAIGFWEVNRVIDVLYISLAPFHLFVSIGAATVCLVLIGDIVEILLRMKGDR
jgi:TRAP-type C4-dicarboxylate transport system permease small subunit